MATMNFCSIGRSGGAWVWAVWQTDTRDHPFRVRTAGGRWHFGSEGVPRPIAHGRASTRTEAVAAAHAAAPNPRHVAPLFVQRFANDAAQRRSNVIDFIAERTRRMAMQSSEEVSPAEARERMLRRLRVLREDSHDIATVIRDAHKRLAELRQELEAIAHDLGDDADARGAEDDGDAVR